MGRDFLVFCALVDRFRKFFLELAYSSKKESSIKSFAVLFLKVKMFSRLASFEQIFFFASLH